MSRQLTSGVIGRRRREKKDEWLYKGEVWEYEEVTSPHTSRVWMDRNLGAALSANTNIPQSFGDLFQWGRLDDLHQNINSLTTATLSDSDTPDDGKFILTSAAPNDWRSPKNDNLWQLPSLINIPAPPGFRLPTMAEWFDESNNFDNTISNKRDMMLQSFLKLPFCGRRNYVNGSVEFGGAAYYWSSNVDGNNANRLTWSSTSVFQGTDQRARGCSVRLIKEQ